MSADIVSEKQSKPGLRLRRREAVESYIFLTLLSFAASVSLTRLFLSLSGYPQIGGGELHIAHVLWGGLLLFAAALLPLILENRWVYSAGALLAGVGVGLFIDEVGKFITQRNDYFYPAAAPIVYTFFLLTILLFLNLRRLRDAGPYTELHRALSDIQQMLEKPLKPEHHAQLRSRLDELANNSSTAHHADLARALLKFVEGEKIAAIQIKPRPLWWIDLSKPQPMLTARAEKALRILLVGGLLFIGLLTLKNPAETLLARWLPEEMAIFLSQLHAGRRIVATTAPFWFEMRIALEIAIGSLLLVSAYLSAVGRTNWGSKLGYMALLLSLTTINLLLFYFEQFSTVMTTTTQFLLLLGIVYYRGHTPTH